MKSGDLCWTRDKSNCYWLGRIIGPWEYRKGARYLKADIVNLRKCEWVKIGLEDEVAGKLVCSFIPRATLQHITNPSLVNFSKLKFNQLARETYALSSGPLDVFELLSADELEDVILLFLQERGYYLIPSSRRNSTAHYHCCPVKS